jgi:hypothetical protein
MFTQIWKKYLPVIVLLMKKADQGEQVLDMNRSDFERATGGKKVRFGFSEMRFGNGRISYQERFTALANDLLLLLQENEKVRGITATRLFEFTMTNNFQLKIKNVTPVEEASPVESD